MKINPFSKKPLGRYFDKLQAEYTALNQQLDAAKQAQAQAEAEFEAKDKAYRDLEARSNASYSSPEEKRLHLIRSQVEQQMREAKSHVRDLQDRIAPRHRQVTAPTQMVRAKETYQRLKRQKQDGEGEWAKTQALKVKLEQRVAQAEQRILAETQAAAQALADADGEGALPEGLSKLDMELRLTQATLVEVQKKLDHLGVELKQLPKQIAAARDEYVSYRATVAELELLEQLPAFVEVVARAAVAKHVSNSRHAANRFEIEIPEDVVVAMKETLSAELSA